MMPPLWVIALVLLCVLVGLAVVALVLSVLVLWVAKKAFAKPDHPTALCMVTAVLGAVVVTTLVYGVTLATGGRGPNSGPALGSWPLQDLLTPPFLGAIFGFPVGLLLHRLW
jgi:H+/gluconate symporter-like permease